RPTRPRPAAAATACRRRRRSAWWRRAPPPRSRGPPRRRRPRAAARPPATPAGSSPGRSAHWARCPRSGRSLGGLRGVLVVGLGELATDDLGDRGPLEADHDVVGQQQVDRLVTDRVDAAVQPADRDDVGADVELLLHLLDGLLALALRPDHG